MSSSRSSKTGSSKKPPLPFGTSSIGRSYSTLNRFLLNDILSPSSSGGSSSGRMTTTTTTANQLEVPDAATTYRSSSYRSPSTTSMLFGTMTSTRKRSTYDKIKSSSPISSFRRSSDKYSSSGDKYRDYHHREETTSLSSRFPTSTSLLSAASSPSTGRGRGTVSEA